MSAKAKETKYIKTHVPDEERCLFSTINGNRCRNPHQGNATGYCISHEARVMKDREKKEDEGEVRAVAEQLLTPDVRLHTKEDVNRFTSQLLILVAQKRISRKDGSLLAYIASVLLQTIEPGRQQEIVPEMVEYPERGEYPEPVQYVERVAEPIPETRAEFNRKVAERFKQKPLMPGRSYNPYTYPSNFLKR